MAKYEYSIRSKDETAAGVKSAQKNLDGLEGSVKKFSKTLQLLMGGAALAGVTAALRAVARVAGEAEKAFATMHPETQKAAGSLADWNRAMKDMQAAGGGVVANILTPIRAALLDIIDPAHQAKLAIEQLDGAYTGWAAKYTTSATRLAESIADAQKMLAEATKVAKSTSGEIAEYQRMLSVLKSQGRPDYYERANELLAGGYESTTAYAQAAEEVVKYDQSVKFLTDAIAELKAKLTDATRAMEEIPKWIEEQKKPAAAQPPVKVVVPEVSKLVEVQEDIAKEMRDDLIVERAIHMAQLRAAAVPTAPPPTAEQEARDEALIERAIHMQQLRSAAAPKGEPKTPWEQLGANWQTTREMLAGGDLGAGLKSLRPLFESLKTVLSPLIAQFASFSMIMNPLQTIMQAFLAAITPIVNQLLAPLVGILTIIGQTLAAVLTPALQILSPIIEFLGKAFVWLYNKAIVPMGNAFIAVFTALKAFATMIYYIVTFQWKKIGKIKWTAGEGTLLQPIDYETLASAGTAATGQGSSATATYSTGRDITVNVEVNTEVITGENGGLRELALIIQREINNAIALGVA